MARGPAGKNRGVSKISKWYKADDESAPFHRRQLKKATTTKLRSDIAPGTVLILLAGKFRGKRVVFLKQLKSGLLLVTGPYKINGVPLKRVNQAYTISTSTKVDLAGVNAAKFEDAYFARETANKSHKTLFKADLTEEQKKKETERKVARKADQQAVDSALLASVKKVQFLKGFSKLMLTDYIHNNFDQPTQRKNKNKKADKVSDSSANKDQKNRQSKSSSSSENERKNSEESKIVDEHHHEHHLGEHLKEKIQEFIGHVKFVPDFVKDNPYIFSGYRINFNTPKKVLKSLFMLHNELVNVWTHLGGAIALIIICIVLCFSVTNLDTQNLNQFVQTEIKDLFEPIYDRLPDFSQFETTKNEIARFSENTLINLEHKLESITKDIDKVKEDINPEAVGRLLMKVKDQLEGFAEHFENIHFDKQKLNEMSGKLKNKVNQLQDELLVQIDSSKFDWIDIYKFIHPTYGTSKALVEGHHLIPVSRWPIIVFLLSAVFCLMCSAVFHLFYCLNKRTNEILLRLDYAGVSILITGSCFPCFVYGFYCLPTYAYIYLTIIGITSLIVFFVSLGDKIHSQEMRKVKSIMYASLGTFAAFPMPHLVYLSWTRTEQNDHLDFSPSLPYYLAMGASYLGGLVIYTSKWPEKCKPGKFDIFGHSHQIWHVCVLLGIVFTYFGAFDNYYTRMEIPCIGCGL